MSKKRVYKVGDIVRIIDPKFVARVGYPWTKQYVKENIITNEQKQAIQKLIEEFEEKSERFRPDLVTSRVYDKILDALAFKVLSEKRFGGRERSIHTFTEEKAKNLLAMVIGKRVVRTGVYIPATLYGGYFEEIDVDPAHLDKSKTHVLLEVNVFAEDSFTLREQIELGNKFEDIYTYAPKIEIEECNIEIVELTETQKKNQKTIASWQDIKL